MAMPIENFRNDIVEPNIRDFEAAPNSMFRGFNAVSSVDAFAAHIFYALKDQGLDPFEKLGRKTVKGSDDSAFRQELALRSNAFELLRDLAKANKHAFLDRHNPRVNGSDDTRVKLLGYGDGTYGSGAFSKAERLTVTDVKEVEYSLPCLVTEAMSFLDDFARSHQLY